MSLWRDRRVAPGCRTGAGVNGRTASGDYPSLLRAASWKSTAPTTVTSAGSVPTLAGTSGFERAGYRVVRLPAALVLGNLPGAIAQVRAALSV